MNYLNILFVCLEPFKTFVIKLGIAVQRICKIHGKDGGNVDTQSTAGFQVCTICYLNVNHLKNKLNVTTKLSS